MRRFWLKKGDNIWDLTSKDNNGSFLGDIDGLGAKLKIESYEIERASFVESVKMDSGEISGSLYFYDYEHFTKFIDFIGTLETTSALRLYYSTSENYNYNSNDEWYKEVLIKELKKSEIEYKTSCLICKVKFSVLSRWKKDKIFNLELDSENNNSDVIYPYLHNGLNYIAVNIDNTNNLPTSCKVIVEAITDAPEFKILQNDKIVDQAKYHVFIREGSYLLVDSKPEQQQASVITGEITEDAYYLGEKDYSYSNFITIPEGKSLFLFRASNNPHGKLTLSFSIQKEIV